MIRSSFKFLPTLAAILFFINQIYAQKCPVAYGYQGSENFSRASKATLTIEKTKELSPLILSRINEQLKKRVGEKFASKLKLEWGYVHDFDDEAALRDAKSTDRIDAYDLVYKLSDKAKGLKAYYFKVVLDEKGNLTRDVNLPDIASYPQKRNLISCRQASEIAAKNGFPQNRISMYFNYDFDSQSLAWEIYDKQAVEPDRTFLSFGGQGTYRKILIDAATGNVIKIYKETIIL
ncbi:MAG TPA: hypothetical protein VGC76_13780 [Pyrinomonadaceae bacterium]|jgi:hypothetical protein